MEYHVKNMLNILEEPNKSNFQLLFKLYTKINNKSLASNIGSKLLYSDGNRDINYYHNIINKSTTNNIVKQLTKGGVKIYLNLSKQEKYKINNLFNIDIK